MAIKYDGCSKRRANVGGGHLCMTSYLTNYSVPVYLSMIITPTDPQYGGTPGAHLQHVPLVAPVTHLLRRHRRSVRRRRPVRGKITTVQYSLYTYI